MKLAAYLKLKNMTHDDFAKEIEVSTSAVQFWCSGERTPRPKYMRRIVNFTNGAVTPNDFHDASDEMEAAQ